MKFEIKKLEKALNHCEKQLFPNNEKKIILA